MKRKYTWHVLSFLLPFVVVVIISIANGVYPFGDRCLLHIDMYHQYCPFFTEFMNKLKCGESLMYTWNQGLGTDFVALYAYYLASPLNFLLILCPKNHVIEFMTLLTWIKISGCGLTFFLFLKEHWGLNPRSLRCGVAVAFSTAYALSGFVAAYSWDIMWMDVVMMAPLAIMGVDLLIRQKRASVYYVSLALAIWSNYYISIMLCIFLVLYFVARLVIAEHLKPLDYLWATIRFGGYSLLAGATCGVLLIPEMLLLSYAGSSTDTFPSRMEWYFNLLGEVGRSCVTGSVYTGGDHWPNLYAGSFVLLLLVLFALNREIGLRKRILGIAGVAFFLVSFANNQLDYMWHGFHFPNSLPGRQSYLYIFLVLILGYEELRHIRGTKIWQVIAAVVLWIPVLIAGAVTTDEEVTEVYAFVLTALFVACYGALLLIYKLARHVTRKQVMILACFVAVCEVIIHFSVTGFYTTGRSEYVEKTEDYEALLGWIEEQENAKRELGGGLQFYRVEDPQRMTKNDNMLYDYKGATVFSSLMNLNVSHFYQSLYMEGGKNYYCYNGATPLTSAMLSVRYMLYDSDTEENAFRHVVAQSGDQYLYENTYCLPLGYMMEEAAIEAWDNSDLSNKLGNLNGLAYALGASEPMLVNCTESAQQTVSGGETTLTMDSEGYYYAAYRSCSADRLEMNTSEGRSRVFSKTTHRYLLELGLCRQGEEISLTNSDGEAVEYSVYRLDEAVVGQAYETLSRQTLQLQDYGDTYVEGDIHVDWEGRLIFSIPFESGWRVYVDGEEVQAEAFQDAMISVHLTEGDHHIRLQYETPGIRTGALFSVIGICGFALLTLLEARYRKHVNERREKL